MRGIVLLDTLHLNIRYPYQDTFKHWNAYAVNVDRLKLKSGVAAGDFVVRTGASGYPISVWKHDARAYLTDQVDEIRGDGKGMGIWLQLGPKFLIANMNNLNGAVKDLLANLHVRGDWQIRVTRIDLAMDLFDVSMESQDVEAWRQGWVGRSKVSGAYFSPRTGELETINVGKRGSSVFLRVYNKIAQALSEGDIGYWLDVWKDQFSGTVTRIEWEVKPNQGGFSMDLQDFALFNGFSLRELINYLVDWGRLCIPDKDDTNNRRWELAPFWQYVKEVASRWVDGIEWPTSRYGPEFRGISEQYIKFVSGTLSGAMARFDTDKPNMMSLLDGLDKHGEGLQKIQSKAVEKAEIYSRL
jgi:hypothetical protein